MAEKSSKEEKEIQIELVPSTESKLGREYINYAQVSHSPWDFTIKFCQTPAMVDILKLKRSAGKAEIPTIVELIIAPDFLPKIIKALQTNYDRYLTEQKEKDGEPSS